MSYDFTDDDDNNGMVQEDLGQFLKPKPFDGRYLKNWKDFVEFDPLASMLLGTSLTLEDALASTGYTQHKHDPMLVESIRDYLTFKHGVVFSDLLGKWLKRNGYR